MAEDIDDEGELLLLNHTDVYSSYDEYVWSSNVWNASYDVTPYYVPDYIRITMTTIMSVLLVVGVAGNILVPIVIAHSKDLRNSTNVFLVNLALADLLVILICLPTGYVELHSSPGVWYLGKTMCLMVTFVELIAPHASVLTILAISFERYYAICRPLKAGYICTKSRAMVISIFTWLSAGILTSPIIGLTEYGVDAEYLAHEPSCGPRRDYYWTKFYYIGSFTLFFLIPCVILLVLYALIAQNLYREPTRPSADEGNNQRHSRRPRRLHHTRHLNSNRARRQVVTMLGTVVVSFFFCLLPFRLLTLISPPESEILSTEKYDILVNLCRVMVYLNSAVNPILYNLMSSKFRNGFLRLFGLRNFIRQGTVSSSSTAVVTNAAASSSSSSNHSNVVVSVVHRPISYRLSSNDNHCHNV